MNIHATSKLAATRELRAKMQGRVVSWGDDDYARTRRVWNGAVENQPALFAVCETSADVQAAVRSARQHGFPLSVRGGGHDWAGRALCPDGLVVDLSRMRQVIVDPRSRIATVSGCWRLHWEIDWSLTLEKAVCIRRGSFELIPHLTSV